MFIDLKNLAGNEEGFKIEIMESKAKRQELEMLI
jgi:hypothetical protein